MNLLGIDVIVNNAIPDGSVVMIGREVVVIGTCPRTELELAGHHARWLVQQGLMDVLEWLGEKPIPKHPPTGAAILARLRRTA